MEELIDFGSVIDYYCLDIQLGIQYQYLVSQLFISKGNVVCKRSDISADRETSILKTLHAIRSSLINQQPEMVVPTNNQSTPPAFGNDQLPAAVMFGLTILSTLVIAVAASAADQSPASQPTQQHISNSDHAVPRLTCEHISCCSSRRSADDVMPVWMSSQQQSLQYQHLPVSTTLLPIGRPGLIIWVFDPGGCSGSTTNRQQRQQQFISSQYRRFRISWPPALALRSLPPIIVFYIPSHFLLTHFSY